MRDELARVIFWERLRDEIAENPWCIFALWAVESIDRDDAFFTADAILASDWLRDTLAAEREAEKARIVAELRAQADVTPCFEDAGVMSSAADLVEADFSFERAEEIAAIRNLEPGQ